MNKSEFLIELENALKGLPQEEIQSTLDFYSEVIDDRIEYCLSEELAVATVGNAQDIANEIFMDIPMPEQAKIVEKSSRKLRAWEIVLLVLGSPIWISLLAAAVVVLLAVYVVIWSAVISLWAVEISLWACAFSGVVAPIVFAVRGYLLTGLVLLGAGLFCIGLSIFMLFACKLATKGILILTKKIALRIKMLFVKKEGAK